MLATSDSHYSSHGLFIIQRKSTMFGDSVVKQPSLDGPGPHMTGYPAEGVYESILSIPDEVIWENSENQPPVEVVN